MPTVGELLRKAIDAKGVTQTELAAAVGVDEATISRWVRDTGRPDRAAVKPNPFKLDALALALGIPPALLREAAGYPLNPDPAMDYLQSTAAKLTPERRAELARQAAYQLWLQENEKK